MFPKSVPLVASLVLGVSMMTGLARADGLKDEIAPTGKLRVAIAISPAGGAFWSTKTETGGYAGVPVDLGKEMAAQLGVPVEYVVHQNSGQITDAASKGTWDVTFLPKDPERETRMSFGPIYEVADATYIVRAGSSVTNFQMLDQPGVKVAAVNDTTTMRGAMAHLKQATVTGYQTYDEIFGLLRSGEIDAFALSRDQLNAMAKKIPGTRVLNETFKQTVTAVAVPLNHPQSLAFNTEETIGAAHYLLNEESNPHLPRALRARARRWRPKWTSADGLVIQARVRCRHSSVIKFPRLPTAAPTRRPRSRISLSVPTSLCCKRSFAWIT